MWLVSPLAFPAGGLEALPVPGCSRPCRRRSERASSSPSIGERPPSIRERDRDVPRRSGSLCESPESSGRRIPTRSRRGMNQVDVGIDPERATTKPGARPDVDLRRRTEDLRRDRSSGRRGTRPGALRSRETLPDEGCTPRNEGRRPCRSPVLASRSSFRASDTYICLPKSVFSLVDGRVSGLCPDGFFEGRRRA